MTQEIEKPEENERTPVISDRKRRNKHKWVHSADGATSTCTICGAVHSKKQGVIRTLKKEMPAKPMPPCRKRKKEEKVTRNNIFFVLSDEDFETVIRWQNIWRAVLPAGERGKASLREFFAPAVEARRRELAELEAGVRGEK